MELLAACLQTAGLEELGALGGVHMHLGATGALNDLHAITRRLSRRLQAEGRMDSTSIAIRQAVLAARQSIGTALSAAPMRASADLETHVIEAASDLGAYVVIHGHLDPADRRSLTAPYTDIWPELGEYLPGLAAEGFDIDAPLDNADDSSRFLASLAAESWDVALSALLDEAAEIETDHARAFEAIQQFAEQAWSEDAWNTMDDAVQRAQLALTSAGRDAANRVEAINDKAGEAASQALRFSAMLATEQGDTSAQLGADDQAMYQAGSSAIFAERAALAVAARDLINDPTFTRLYYPWALVMGGSEDDRSYVTHGFDETITDTAGLLEGWPVEVPALPTRPA